MWKMIAMSKYTLHNKNKRYIIKMRFINENTHNLMKNVVNICCITIYLKITNGSTGF